MPLPATRRVRSDNTHDRRVRPAPKEKKVNKHKKDERKNMYGYSFKFIVKEFLSPKYEPFLNKLCDKFETRSRTSVKEFY
jgi:hypothetical protein